MKGIDKNRIPIFVFIGSDKHYVDAIAPRVGSIIEKYYSNAFVFGTKNSNVDAKTCTELSTRLQEIDKDIFQVIALDVGFCSLKGRFKLLEGGIKPASGIRKNLPRIGEIGIVINIDNVYGTNKYSDNYISLIFNKYNRKIQKKINKITAYTVQLILNIMEECDVLRKV
jgi:putative sporulation protein YyaC